MLSSTRDAAPSGAQDGLQSQNAIAGAREVPPLVRAHALRFEVVERGANDRERRAQFVRELAAESPQILRMLVEAPEQSFEGSRQRADLVRAARFGHVEADAAVAADGAESAASASRPMRRLIQRREAEGDRPPRMPSPARSD